MLSAESGAGIEVQARKAGTYLIRKSLAFSRRVWMVLECFTKGVNNALAAKSGADLKAQERIAGTCQFRKSLAFSTWVWIFLNRVLAFK